MWFRLAQSILFCVILFLQFSAPAAPSLQFHAADADSKTAEIRFEPFQSVDWQRLARRYLKDFNLNHPTPEQVARLKKHLLEHPDDETGSSSEIRFVSPLETGMTHGFYYLLSGGDLRPLQLLRLNGTMGFALNHQKTAIVPGVFYGQIVAKTGAPPAEDAAFVVFSDTSLASTTLSGTRFTAQKVGKQDAYLYEREGRKWTLTVQDEGLFDVLSASFFKIG
jgi:hypothetical protein